MPPTCLPAMPAFADESESVVWGALKHQLRECDVLLHGVRFTDFEYGEVEADLLVLMPDRGAVGIEVKGGAVSYP